MAADGISVGSAGEQKARRRSFDAVDLSPAGRKSVDGPFSPGRKASRAKAQSGGGDRGGLQAFLKAAAMPALGVAMILGVLGVATVQSVRNAHARPLPAGLETARRGLAEVGAAAGLVNRGAMPTQRVLMERRELMGWTDGGRATWYGGPGGPGPDGMDISQGSCGFGNKVFENEYVAAVNTNGGYDWGLTDQCDVCFEVMCKDGDTRGLDHSREAPDSGCVEPGVRSVVVRISDSCPCHHPNTSNQKWCCGDKMHFDLSYVAFDAIAKRDKGVVDLMWRKVDCSRQGEMGFYDEGGNSVGGGDQQVVTAMSGPDTDNAWASPPPPPPEEWGK